MTRLRYRFFSHTADVRLRLYGKNEEELFTNGVLALKAFLWGAKEIKRFVGYEKIQVLGSGWENLLVNFLNEILSRSQINKKIYGRVKFTKFSSNLIEAQIFGAPVRGFKKDIKAVSYHQNAIKNKDGFLEATLVLDI